MEDRKVPWWRKALSFAMSGFRSGFGLFSRTQKNGTENQPEIVAGENINSEEEIELIKDSPKPETISEAETAAATFADANVAAAELVPAPGSGHEENAGEPPVAESATDEIVVTEEVFPVPVESSAEGIDAVTKEVLTQTTEQPGAAEHESVDEATPEAETPVNVEPFPQPANQPMDLRNSIPEETVEKDTSAEVAQTAEATKGAPSHAHEPEAEAVAEPTAAASETDEDVREMAPANEEPSDRGGEGAAEPASETAQVADAATNPANIQASTDSGTKPAAASVKKAVAPQHPSKPFIKLESRDNEADLSAFSVIVSQVYDGPLDLLLDLIRKQDIDIYDIPIARITAQFLAYVNQLKATDVDVAGEFIYTASLLIHIKSKMLLPRAPAGPDDAAEDPRRELVERLLEHERFKNAAQMLQQKQMLEAASWTNPGIREFQDDASAEPEIAADTVDLVRVFRDILDRARNRPVINVEEDSVTVGQMIQFLARRLTMEDKPVALRRLLSHTRSERALIAMFLALLELVRLQAILLRQDRAFSEIFIKKHTGFEAVMNEGMANARDDWR